MAAAAGRARRVARLAAEAQQAARVRELTTHPDVIALRVERVRAQVDGLLWAGIVLGLTFTMVNVQEFAADGAGPDSPAWWVAWLLDPMVSLVLLAVLRAEQVTARYQVALPAWAQPPAEVELLRQDEGAIDRATAFAVVAAAEVHRYPVIVVENVVEFARWVLFNWWLAGLHALGYRTRVLRLNAAAFGHAQRRVRLFVVATRDGVDLDLTPPALAPVPATAVLDDDPGEPVARRLYVSGSSILTGQPEVGSVRRA